MKRRNFVASVLAGSVATPTLLADERHDHDHGDDDGPEDSVTVSFGSWMIDPPLDRFTKDAPNSANNHTQSPFRVEVKVGGSVNFVISGFHILGIYGPGTKLADVNGTLTMPIPGAPVLPPPAVFPPVVNDPLDRVYWGVNPFSLVPAGSNPPLDRVEAVTFSARGTYLVVCTFVPHFLDKMHGFVKVLK